MAKKKAAGAGVPRSMMGGGGMMMGAAAMRMDGAEMPHRMDAEAARSPVGGRKGPKSKRKPKRS